jgi:hypothetical protein
MPCAAVSGTAADLVLLLYGRRELTEVEVQGDPKVLEAFIRPIK